MIKPFTPFYELAKNLWMATQEKQIVKGLHKYEEPFDPRSWTNDELLNHALEESVDLTHYLVGLKVKLDDHEKNIARLRAKYDDIVNEKIDEIIYLRGMVERLERENERLKNEPGFLFLDLGSDKPNGWKL